MKLDATSDWPYPDFSSTAFGRTTRVNVRPYRTEPYRTKFGKLVRQSSVINITLFGRKGGKLTSGSVTIVSRIPAAAGNSC